MFKKAIFLFLVFISTWASAQFEGASTGYGNAQQPAAVQKATVLAVRDVKLAVQNSGFGSNMMGTLIGGAVGGIVGRQSNDFNVMAIATTLGSAIGNHVANGPSVREAQEVIVQMDGSGNTFAITQNLADGVRFAPGQKVIIIGGGRIAPANF